jgi:hypothetical protein
MCFGPRSSTSIPLDVTKPFTLPAALPDGWYQLGAQAKDLGQAANTTIPLALDRAAPSLCMPNWQSSFPASDGAVYASVDDATSGVGSLTWLIDGAKLTTLTWPDGAPAGALWQANYKGLSEGTHTLATVCVDRAGNSVTSMKHAVIDNPPQGNVYWLGQGQGSSGPYRIAFTDKDGIKLVQGTIQCSSSGSHPAVWSVPGQPTVYDQTFTLSGLVVGETCQITAYAYDVHDEYSTRTQTFVVADTQPKCNAQQNSGDDTPESYVINVGKQVGTVEFARITYQAGDILEVTCADGGSVAGASEFSTGCESTGDGWFTNSFAINCATPKLRVTVTPNCTHDDGTLWSFVLGCAQ